MEVKMGNKDVTLLTDNPLVKEFYDNTQSNIIRITDDKLKVILLENKEMLVKNHYYIAPLTLFITMLLTFCTADFKIFLSLSAETWKGFYLFLTIFSIVWLIIVLIRIKKSITIDKLIGKIRTQENNIVIEKSHETTQILSENLIIHSATYGKYKETFDVTDKLKSFVVEGNLTITPNDEIFGDPCPGVFKELNIDYTYKNKRDTRTIPQGKELIIK